MSQPEETNNEKSNKTLKEKYFSDDNLWRISYFCIGLWLVFLYLIFVYAVLFSLTIHQFKSEIESIPADFFIKKDIDIFEPHFCNISDLIKIFENKEETNTENTNTENENLEEEYKYDIESSFVEIPCVRKNRKKENKYMVADLLREIIYENKKAKIKKEEKNNEEKQKDDTEQKDDLEKNSEPIIFTESIDLQINQQNEEIKKLVDKLEKSKLEGVDREIVQGNLDTAKRDLEYLEERKIAYVEFGNKTLAIMQDSEFYNKIFSSLAPGLKVEEAWKIPQAFLDLLLILSMGGLGSLITVTIEFIKVDKNGNINPNIRPSRFIFRPMLGTIVALAVYISIRSGHISMGNESSGEFSPFVLSFIGILSGIMSEYFYIKLVKKGRKLLEDKT